MYMADQEEVGLALGLSLGSGGATAAAKMEPPSLTLSLTGAAVKREEDDGEDRRAMYYSAAAADDDVDGCSRKKLRLSKEQSALLEERFKEHSTLNPKQKAALARQLMLRPRQVEVWFQNRRARTKLKQTEVDCELLRRCCQTLTDENRRLHRELQHLRALHRPATATAAATALSVVCPSCDRLAAAATAPADRPAGAERSFFAAKSAAC